MMSTYDGRSVVPFSALEVGQLAWILYADQDLDGALGLGLIFYSDLFWWWWRGL